MRPSRIVTVLAAVTFAIAAPVSAGAAASSSSPVEPTTGSIAGKIVDTNNQPINGECVWVWDAEWNLVAGSTSRLGGTYLVYLPSGTYTVEYSGCGTSNDPNVQAEFYNDTQSSDASTKVVVATGVQKQLDTQTMQVGGEISLQLLDLNNQPIPDVRVELQAVSPLPSFLRVNVGAKAPDADGRVTFSGLLPGTYRLAYESCPVRYCVIVGYYANQAWDSTSPTSFDVVPGTPKVLNDNFDPPVVVGTTTTVTASSATSTVSQPLTISAHVTADDNSVPTGYVDMETSTVDLGTVEVGPTGTASITTSDLPVGTWNVWVNYYGYALVAPSEGYVTVTVSPASTGGGSGGSGGSGTGGSGGSGGSGGGGGGGGGGGAPAGPVPTTSTVPADGSLSSDPAGTKPDVSNPLVVGVTSPTGGTVSIDKTPPNSTIGNYRVLNVGATITAPAATASDPLKLSFQVFDGTLPAGSYASDLTVFRDGVAVSQCTNSGVASPDPCVNASSTSGGITTIDILSSHASTWDVEAADVGRISGADRVETAAAVSRDSFPSGNAGAVVLARADEYPDALVGAPLAAAKNAPLLLTQGASLPEATRTEISRVLPAGGTVYVLGSKDAIPLSVETQLTTLGYKVMRYGGTDRYETALLVAAALGNPSTVFLATGTNFPDGLTAGPAASHLHGAILLTAGGTLRTSTKAYLDAKATTVYAIGGPAAAADPAATPVFGIDRFATAADVAAKFFTSPTTVGVATGATFPDALSGGAQLALTGSPLLLSAKDGAPDATTNYLAGVSGNVATVHLYGGTSTLTDAVLSQVRSLVGGS